MITNQFSFGGNSPSFLAAIFLILVSLMRIDFRKCRKCRKPQIPAYQLRAHEAECPGKCPECHQRIPGGTDQFDAHVVKCSISRCWRCERRISRDEWDSHESVCSESIICEACRQPIEKSAYLFHRSHCWSQLSHKRDRLLDAGNCMWLRTLNGKPCPNPQIGSEGFCEEHAEEYATKKNDPRIERNASADQQRFWKILLSNALQPQFWRSSALSHILKNWKENPKTVVICDIEGARMGNRDLSPLNVFQIALKNASEEWIIEPTLIHHEISKRDLYAFNESFLQYRNGLAKFYGKIDAIEAKGVGPRTATGKAIGQELENYVEKHGKLDTWLEWSMNSCDWKGIYCGLASVGYERLMPPRLTLKNSPFGWWLQLKKLFVADLDGLKLKLVNVFQILYPEEVEIISGAHSAGPDVQMLTKILQYVLADATPLKGKIESLSPLVNLNPKESDDELLEDDEGDEVESEDDEGDWVEIEDDESV